MKENPQLKGWNDTAADYPKDRCVHQLFEEQAKRTPDAVAAVFGDQSWTYRELNERANRTALRLRALGVGPEILAGIFVERSLEMLSGLLGILKAGGAYVPLDPDYPRDRLAFMVGDSGVKVLLTQKRLVDALPPHQAAVICLDDEEFKIQDSKLDTPNSESGVHPKPLAYVIYTSGSTGKPKGVQIQHGSLVNFLASMRRAPGLTENDTLLSVTTLSFDIAALEIFLPLTTGARVLLASRDDGSDGLLLANHIAAHRVTVMQATPVTWRVLLESGWEGSSRLKILCGGEALSPELAARLLPKCAELWNMYGPTETTGWSTIERVQPGKDGISIGRPIANTEIYIVDPRLEPVPAGVSGELLIGGDGVARGYLNRPELTAEKFIPHPFNTEPGARLYRTGDLARYRPDGSIECLGRMDHQVKIRGHRIELGEIESAMLALPGVRESVVVVRKDSSGEPTLVGYVTPKTGHEASDDENGKVDALWQEVWDAAYRGGEAADPTFNAAGVNSSFTGKLIPEADLREWVGHTVDRILALHPKRTLEIGCGAGLLLFRIAPRCEHYAGLDFSPAALAHIAQHAKTLNLTNLKLSRKSADEIAPNEEGPVDAVIMNGVLQYFPDAGYLLRVLEKALDTIEDGGFMFIGDVRSRPLVRAFHAAVALHHSPDDLPISALEQRVERKFGEEPELVLDPAFFDAIQRQFPRIKRVELQLKRGRHSNELNCFRYDVILRVGPERAPTVNVAWLAWDKDGLGLEEIRRRLAEEEPAFLAIGRVPNARLSQALGILNCFSSRESPKTAGELRAQLARDASGVDPEAFWEMEQDLPYAVEIRWPALEADGRYEVIFRHRTKTSADSIIPARSPAPDKPPTEYANQPAGKKAGDGLIPKLRAFLREKLPDPMIPSAFVVLEKLPLTPNGKLDRNALPAPDHHRPELDQTFVAPRTPTEQKLADIWSKVLNLERVGIHDNFFDIGGHSLLAIQAVMRVNQSSTSKLSLPMVFEHPTVASLAIALDRAAVNPTDQARSEIKAVPRQQRRARRATGQAEHKLNADRA